MNIRLIFTATIYLLAFTIKAQPFKVSPCISETSSSHPKGSDIQDILNKMVHLNIPGAVASVSDNLGTWTGIAGYARLEDATPMGTCHLHYLQSIAKTYMAVVIMRLYEDGKIDLDAKATRYLPKVQIARIPGIEKVTVRMLLNHTSGLPEYNYDPTYITRLLQNPDRMFTPVEYINYVEKKKPMFEAGSKYVYLNFGYALLSIIADQITGEHAAYMRENIFEPLGLKNTFYQIKQGKNYNGQLVNSYWDRHGNGTLENISVLQNSNVASMAGDDGLITSPEEAILFLKGLMEGKLLKPQTLGMMQEWVKDSKGNPRYGFGLTYTTIAGEKAIGHSGGGLGSGCELYYFPEKKVYMFLAINLGTVTSSPIHIQAEKMLNKLHSKFAN